MTKTRAILLLLILGVAAFLFVRLYPGRRISRNFNSQPMASSQPLRSQAISIRFSPDSKFLLVAGSVGKGSLGRYQNGEYLLDYKNKDTRLRLFNVAKQNEIERLKAQPLFGGWYGDHMLITPDFRKLITTSHHENLKIIDVRKKLPDRSMEVQHHDSPYRETITSMEISPNGKVLALGTVSGAIFYDLRTFHKLKSYDHYGGNFGADVFFGRGSDVVMLMYRRSKRPHFVSVKTGKRILTPSSTREFRATNSPDGEYFAEVKDRNQLEIWQRSEGKSKKVKTWVCGLVEIQTIQFSSDGKMLAVGGSSSTDNPVRFYKLSDIRQANKS